MTIASVFISPLSLTHCSVAIKHFHSLRCFSELTLQALCLGKQPYLTVATARRQAHRYKQSKLLSCICGYQSLAAPGRQSVALVPSLLPSYPHRTVNSYRSYLPLIRCPIEAAAVSCCCLGFLPQYLHSRTVFRCQGSLVSMVYSLKLNVCFAAV